MVIGGQAVLLYGEPRLTRDIDITLAVGTDDLPGILEFVRKLRLRVLVSRPAKFVKRTMVLPVEQESTGIRVDFIFSSSEYERSAIARVAKVKLGGTSVKFISVEDLIIHKVIGGRPRDIDDVQSVLSKNPRANVKLIQIWLRRFDRALDSDYLRTFKRILKEIQ